MLRTKPIRPLSTKSMESLFKRLQRDRKYRVRYLEDELQGKPHPEDVPRYGRQQSLVRERILRSFPPLDRWVVVEVLKKSDPKQMVEELARKEGSTKSEARNQINQSINRVLSTVPAIKKEYAQSNVREVRDLFSNQIGAIAPSLQFFQMTKLNKLKI